MDEGGQDVGTRLHTETGLKLTLLVAVALALVGCDGDLIGSVRADMLPKPNTDTTLRLAEGPLHSYPNLLTVTGQKQTVVNATCTGSNAVLVAAEVDSGVGHTYRARVNSDNFLDGQAGGSFPSNRGIFKMVKNGDKDQPVQVFEVDIDFPNAVTFKGDACTFTIGHGDVGRVDPKRSAQPVSQVPDFSPAKQVIADAGFTQPAKPPELIKPGRT
ncbi:MAG: hypothetical protein WC775_05655 [Patescibacteria group bacterium]|jgi:hypothetical protein